MSLITTKTREIKTCPAGKIPKDVFSSAEPVIIKGLIKDWKLVALGNQSANAAVDYLKSHYNDKSAIAYFGDADIAGRYFYNSDATQLNYETKKVQIDEFLDLILAGLNKENPPSYYIASNVIDTHFPCLREENDIDIPRPEMGCPVEQIRAGIWMGNRTTACCHYDASDNMACCVAGKRRFTLFPPDQIANLYPGPLELTPGGQALSMVDFAKPDLQKHPNFSKAIACGQVAELEPGDALFLPSMWWHQVEGLSPFNILVNYWWSETARFAGSSMNVLYHAILSLRDKPELEKKAWKHVFDYYIFGDSKRAAEHLPLAAQNYLGELDERKARALRAMLLNKLNR